MARLVPAILRIALVALLVVLAVPVAAGAQVTVPLPVDPPVVEPGEQQPPPSDQPAEPGPELACDPELEACGEPCSPDVDEGCGTECEAQSCPPPGTDEGGADESAAGGDGDDRRSTGSDGDDDRTRLRGVSSGGVARVASVQRVALRASVPRDGRLPVTGAEPGVLAGLGTILLLAGWRLRRAVREPA